jgi:hypothetical protein
MGYFFENILQRLQGSRFKYGKKDPANEFRIELDKQLIEAYINKYKSSAIPEKKENARVLSSVMSTTTNQVETFYPRRNTWGTEFQTIYEDRRITFDMAYNAAIDAVLCAKELGFDPTLDENSALFPVGTYLTFHKDKKYYAPTLVIEAEVSR